MSVTRSETATKPGGLGLGGDNETLLIGVLLAVVGVVGVVFVGTPVMATFIASRTWIPFSDHLDALSQIPAHLDRPADAYPEELRAQIASTTTWTICAVALRSPLLRFSSSVRLLSPGGVGDRADGRTAETPSIFVRRPATGEWCSAHTNAASSPSSPVTRCLSSERHRRTRPPVLPCRRSSKPTTRPSLPSRSKTTWWPTRSDGARSLQGSAGSSTRPTCSRRNPDTDLSKLRNDDLRHAQLRPRIVRASWSPLSSATTWQGALTTAFDLTRAGASAGGGADGDNKFFYESAESLLACYLYAAANSQSSMRTVIRWIAQHVNEHVEGILEQLPSMEALEFFRGIFEDDRKTLANIFSTARLIVAAYLDPNVSDAAETTDFTPAAFFDGRPNTLYLVAPPANQERLRVVFNMVIKQFIDAAYAWVLANGRSLDRKVLAILDELPNIAPINNLGGIASTVASQGMQLVSVVQDLSQLHNRYGSNDANTIINNHRALLLLTGVKDTVTLDLASKLLGNIEQTQTSVSRDANGWGRRTRTDSIRETPLAPADLLRQQREGHGTLIYGNSRGAELSLRPWFDNRRLAGRARFVPDGDGPINPLPSVDRSRLSSPTNPVPHRQPKQVNAHDHRQ